MAVGCGLSMAATCCDRMRSSLRRSERLLSSPTLKLSRSDRTDLRLWGKQDTGGERGASGKGREREGGDVRCARKGK